MRQYINLFEGSGDDRDMEQKLLDLINHPSTEPHLREVAERKLAKLRAARAEQDDADAAQAEYDLKSANVPAPLFQVNFTNFSDLTPLPRDRWDDIFMQGNGKKITFREVIDRLKPLGCFKIDFYERRNDAVGSHCKVWFHPEDEPDDYTAIEAVLKGTLAGVANEATYYRGGTSSYFVSFSRYYPKVKKPAGRR